MTTTSRALRTLAATAAALTALLPTPSAVAATGDPELVLETSSDGDSDLLLRRADGSTTGLTANRAADFGAVWSPDGRRLAFVSDRDGDDEVYVMSADGTGVRQLTRNGRGVLDQAPAWSPDGRTLVFTSTRDGGEPEVYRMRADGTAQVRLTRTAAHVGDHTPSFSPGGHYVVFTSYRDGHENAEVYRMRVNGTEVLRLTRTAADVADNAPEYSPDGRRIAFSSTRSGGTHDLWVMGADGTGARRVTTSTTTDEVFPRWTADGRHLVHGTFATEQAPGEVRIVAPDGSGSRRLASGTGALADPRPRVR